MTDFTQQRDKIIAEFREKLDQRQEYYTAEGAHYLRCGGSLYRLDFIEAFLTTALQEMYEAGRQKGHVTLESKEIYRNGFVAGIQRAKELVPQEVSVYEEGTAEEIALNDARSAGWNECRAAILSALEAEQAGITSN